MPEAPQTDSPWLNEPDHLSWTDATTGYECKILRHPEFGELNGYVAVPPSHPWYGKDYDNIDADVAVHGGVTYASGRNGEWWFGFDCANYGDMMPSGPVRDGTYRTIDYVKSEVESLAKQLHAAAETAETTNGGA